MPQQTKAGNIRDGMHAVDVGQFFAGRIELGGRGNHCSIACGIQRTFLQRGRHDANTQWLAKDKLVAGFGIRIAPHF